MAAQGPLLDPDAAAAAPLSPPSLQPPLQPEPHAFPPVVAPAVQKNPRILACVLCQHRKIRCDRNFPCANCTKANVKCAPSTPAPARKRRRPNQDLQERLARCEELLKEYSSNDRSDEQTPSTRSVSRLSDDDQQPSWQPKAKLVEVDGGGVRFMDSFLIGTIHDELRAMREILDAGDDDGVESSEDCSPDNVSELVLGPDTPGEAIEDFWPNPTHVVRLWQVFIERVNPLTKIVHIPSLQPYVAETMNGSHTIPKNIEALLFSIFVIAIMALSRDECRLLLECSKEDALCKYSKGARLYLQRMDFLKCQDLTTLQALVMFVGRCHRQAAWVLNGIVVRLAQQMGLHRDGEPLNLGPFETEMRRRLWWQIIMLDSKYAMQTGLSHSLLPQSGDVKLPTNINDADMHPSATEPFRDRDGPTEMIFVFVICKLSQFLIAHPGIDMVFLAAEMGGVPEGPSREQMLEARQAVEIISREMLEILDRWCDPSAGPVHELVMDIRSQLISRLAQAAQGPLEQSTEESRADVTANAFKIAVKCIEHETRTYKLAQTRCFLWYAQLHFQAEIFAFMCGQLCHRTEGELIDKAWGLVDTIYMFHEELFEVAHNRANTTLGLFVLKAWRRREKVLLARTGHPPDTPFFVDRLRAVLPSVDAKAEAEDQSPLGYTMMDGVNYSPNVPVPLLPPRIGAVTAIITGHHTSGSGIKDGFTMVDPGPRNDYPNPNPNPNLDPRQVPGGGGGGGGGGSNGQVFDQFFTGYMDTTAFEWDMFGNVSADPSLDGAAGSTIPASIFSGAGLGTGLADWYTP